MRKVQNGDMVSVHYTGTLENGEIFDSSEGRSPLQFVVGGGQIIQGFNDAVIGMAQGEEKKITLPPEEAYGYRDDSLVRTIPKTMIGSQFEPQVGLTVGVHMEDGSQVPATISEITDEAIILDLNPPLAGETLNFSITVTDISDAPAMSSCGCGCTSTSCGSSDGGSCGSGGCC